MKSIGKVIPYILLVSFLALSHYKQAQIADSIIIIALSALCGFSMYLESKKTPNYLEEFQEELKNKDNQIKELQTSLGIYNMSQKRKEQVENIVW